MHNMQNKVGVKYLEREGAVYVLINDLISY